MRLKVAGKGLTGDCAAAHIGNRHLEDVIISGGIGMGPIDDEYGADAAGLGDGAGRRGGPVAPIGRGPAKPVELTERSRFIGVQECSELPGERDSWNFLNVSD